MRLACVLVLSLCFFVGCGSSNDGGGGPNGLAGDGGNPDAGGGLLTVAGRVVDNQHVPIAAAPVLVSSGAFQRSTVTDSAGAFMVSGVPTPYDVKTVVTVSGKASGMAYLGLSRPDPTIVVFVYRAPNHTATFTGRLDGGAFTLGPNQNAEVLFSAGPVLAGWYTNSDGSFFGLNLSWEGPATITGTLRGMAWTSNPDGGLPISYDGYGTRPNVNVSDTVALTGQDITLSPVPSGTLSGTFSIPAGYRLPGVSFGVRFATGEVEPLGTEENPAGTSFNFLTPDLPDAKVFLALFASGPKNETTAVIRHGLAASSNVDLQAGSVIALSLPAEAASQVSLATPFTWSAVGDCVYLLAAPQDGTAATFYVLTSQPKARLPDFSALGLSLPASSGFTWVVFDFCPFADLDEAAGPFGPVGVDLLTTNVNSMENRFGVSEVRHFTTAP